MCKILGFLLKKIDQVLTILVHDPSYAPKPPTFDAPD